MTINAGAAPRAPASRWPNSRRSVWLIPALALLVLTPELLSGLTLTDSFRYNLVWSEQFRDLVREGQLYPRWLPESWAGRGSPAFVFYPPLFFWTLAAVDALTLRALSLDANIALASAAVLAASGLAMRAWLRPRAGERAALAGAIGYMLAPYHLYDLSSRGALAEATAYALVPLVALGLERASRSGRGMPLLALSYAGLILAHLPSALLASVLMVPALGALLLFRQERKGPAALRMLAGGLAGLALAAPYWLPALASLRFVSAEALSGPYYQPQPWFFFRLGSWPVPGVATIVVPIWGALVLLCASAWVAGRRCTASEGRFWAVVGSAALVMTAGLLPLLWRLPLLAQVQFPWRFLLLAEFAAITALAVARPRLREPLAFAGAIVAGLALVLVAVAACHRTAATFRRGGDEAAGVLADRNEAPEYLPAGFAVPLGPRGEPDASRIRLRPYPIATVLGAGRIEKNKRFGGGELEISASAEAPATLVARRFAFPAWQVHAGDGRPVALEPYGPERLLSWRVPAGRSRYTLTFGPAPWERAGQVMAGLALLALLLFWAYGRSMARTSSPDRANIFP